MPVVYDGVEYSRNVATNYTAAVDYKNAINVYEKTRNNQWYAPANHGVLVITATGRVSVVCRVEAARELKIYDEILVDNGIGNVPVTAGLDYKITAATFVGAWFAPYAAEMKATLPGPISMGAFEGVLPMSKGGTGTTTGTDATTQALIDELRRRITALEGGGGR